MTPLTGRLGQELTMTPLTGRLGQELIMTPLTGRLGQELTVTPLTGRQRLTFNRRRITAPYKFLMYCIVNHETHNNIGFYKSKVGYKMAVPISIRMII